MHVRTARPSNAEYRGPTLREQWLTTTRDLSASLWRSSAYKFKRLIRKTAPALISLERIKPKAARCRSLQHRGKHFVSSKQSINGVPRYSILRLFFAKFPPTLTYDNRIRCNHASPVVEFSPSHMYTAGNLHFASRNGCMRAPSGARNTWPLENGSVLCVRYNNWISSNQI
ncbi:hypothetical protein EDD15DRAFT_2258287, partial [Pisolithus albus]